MAYTLDFAFFGRTAGVTDWRAQLIDTAGANVGSAISTGFVDVGNGFYQWHYAAIPDAHRGGVKFYRLADSIVLAFGSINPEEAEYTDSKISAVAAAVWAYVARTLTAFGANTLVEFTYTVTDSVTTLPLAGVIVRISTDSGGNNTIWSGTTDAFGVARDAFGGKPRLAAGTYYIWRSLSGYVFSEPDTETIN